jgi:modulator of FtsH protease HflK
MIRYNSDNKTIDIGSLKPSFIPKLLAFIPIIGIILVGAFSCFYTVPPDSVAVVQRFGKFKETSNPGLHFKLPFGIDTVNALPTLRQLTLDFGFISAGTITNKYQRSAEPEQERDMVTGDLNAANVEWSIQYGISSPREYLFNLRAPSATLRDVTESVMCEVIGDRTVDEVLTIGRTDIESEVLEKLQKAVASLNMGIRADSVQLKNVHPPLRVQDSFDDVNRAQQEREQMINEANGVYNSVIPEARGLAAQRISGAEGFAIKRVNEAEGDVTRFKQLLVQYEKSPTVTRQRLYFETMNEVLPKLGSKVIIDEDAKQFLPLMNLNQSGLTK